MLSNEEVFDMKPWSDNNLYVCSPIPIADWPETRKPPPASALTFSDYFIKRGIPSTDLEAFNEFIGRIPQPDIDTSVYRDLLRTHLEIEECKETLVEEPG